MVVVGGRLRGHDGGGMALRLLDVLALAGSRRARFVDARAVPETTRTPAMDNPTRGT